jgi:CheY-specific phosphatase CheX
MNDVLFRGFIAKNHRGSCLTDRELGVLQEGDIDSIVATFIKMKNERYILQLQCVLKTLMYYLGDSIALEQITMKKEYDDRVVVCQLMDGDVDVFFGIGGDDEALLEVASSFAKEEFTEFDSDAYDSVCELVNCTNGSFATKLGDDAVNVVLHPPVFYDDTHIMAEKGFYLITMSMNDKKFNMILSINDMIVMKNYV